MNKKKIIIEGKGVHSVGYRPFLFVKAKRLRIPNYEAENILEDGIQKVIVSVGGEEKQIQRFLEFVKEKYPLEAEVSRVSEAEPPREVMSIDEYDKILAAEQQGKIVQAGLGMINMQEQALGKHDQTIGLQEQMLTKQDQTTESINKGFAETKQDFNQMDVKYDKVSEKMDSIDKTFQKLTAAILKLAESSKR